MGAKHLAVALMLALATGCGESTIATEPVATSIVLTEDMIAFDSLGASSLVGAVVLDQGGSTMAAAPPVGWATSDGSVASVTSGTVVAEGVGTATITASAAGLSATVDVSVDTPQDTVYIDATQHGVSGSTIVGHPVSLSAGTYQATLIEDTYVAWSYAFGNPGTWRTHYRVSLQDGTIVSGGRDLHEADANAAFAASDRIVIEFGVPSAQIAMVYVPDNVLTDNVGGLSLVLQHLHR